MNVKDLIITELDVITAFDVVTGDYLFTLDELQSASLAQGEEKTDITGKQGRKLASLKRNKTVTISGNNGMVSGGLLEMQTGGKFETGETDVMWRDYLTVTDNTATTNYKAVGVKGNEIEHVYIKDESGAVIESLEQAESTSSGKFAYDPTSKQLTFTEIEDGTEIAVFYKRHIQASHLTNESDVYSSKCTLYIDATAEDKCANVYHVQFYIPKADFNGEFTFEMGDNQTVHAFEAEALAGACGVGGMLWTYTVFGEKTEDAGDP